MAYLTPESESSPTTDLSWTQLISERQRPTIVRIDDKPKEINPEEMQLNGSNENGRRPPQRERRESLIGTFNRHLRMSLKAVSESPGPLTRYRQTRFSSRRVRKRVIFKHGDVNVVQGNVAKRRRRYLQDIFTTLVDIQWRWTILVFALNFILSWLFLGVVWYLIAYAHGDIEFASLSPEDQKEFERKLNATYTPCVTEVHSFLSAFLFSLETQHTIGYGHRYVTEACPEAIFMLCLQSIMGVFIQAFMVGVVFAKLSRPKKRAQTLLFSRNAVICHRDGVPCLMFRVGDMRKSHIIEAHVRAQIIKRKVTKEGELLPFYQQELLVGADGSDDRLMFIWPTLIVHKIDEDSPLYELTAQDMLKERFEIVAMLEGVVESTGMTTQARSSYLPSEILWGHRFESVVSFKRETGEYEVDYTLFNNTYETDTPLCSAKELSEMRAESQSQGEADSPSERSTSIEPSNHEQKNNLNINLPNGALPSTRKASFSSTIVTIPDDQELEPLNIRQSPSPSDLQQQQPQSSGSSSRKLNKLSVMEPIDSIC
ncbi:hypothetical protein PVAND_011337 [Polypedilum vanderplanki]|uniref:Inward rectifier potassium channel n=1 Tax=Polypedilum vanderplanki TaxID=319348 RepID=A0A9J6CJ86_POLVA|nr:hypothetical protein PVAND_011337 [Polypedilum vanderplanki]